ncbi:MAG: J domain-containing protein [Paludibacteraceae bacterium]|nr:J domain-containing protein [Paludibacteraceae bacterium]
MTYDQIEAYVSHREKLGSNDSILYLLPFINQLCQLNKGAKEEQNTFLSACLSEDEIEDAFDKEYSDVQMEQSYQYWRGRDLGEMKALMNLLFQLTVEQDGIHNDEWKLLMQIMVQLKFNSRYIEYFKDRYSSLRTEFDDYKRNSTSSQGEYSTVSLESYYAVLGVEKDASIEEIKRAYHELAMQHHPDLPKNANRKEECEAKMMEINEAYEKVRG